MLKLFAKLLILAGLFLVCERLLGHFIFETVKKQNYDKRMELILKKRLDCDLLVMGSSRAARNIVAQEIARETGQKVFNLGYPGSNIDFHLALLNLVISSGRIPKTVMLVVDDPNELIKDDTINFRDDVLSPYLDDDRVFRIFLNHGKAEKLSKYVTTYTQGNKLLSIFSRPTINKFATVQQDGSMPLDFKSVTFNKMVFTNETTYDINKESKELVSSFISFKQICKMNRIRLIVLFPPNFGKPSHIFMERIRRLVGSDTFFIDCSTTITSKHYFYDRSHLDSNGAMILSRKVGEILSVLLVDERNPTREKITDPHSS